MGFRGENIGGEYDKSSRGRHGKWKRESPSNTSGDVELVIPLEGDSAPTASAEETPNTTPESEVVSEEISFSGVKEIPDELLNQLESLLSSNGGWERTPAPIIKGLAAAGFAVHVTERGSTEKPGDTIKIFPPDGSEAYTYSTDDALFFLKEIVSAQRGRAILDVLEKENLPPVSGDEIQEPITEKVLKTAEAPQEEVVEDDGIPVLTDAEEGSGDGIPVLTDVVSEEELRDEALRNGAHEAAEVRQQIVGDEESVSTQETLPVTIEGELVQNHNNPENEVVLGDAGIEDAVILSETPKPNIGKGQRTEKNLVPSERATALTNIVRENENTESQKNEGNRAERPFDTRFASEFGVTKEMWEQIPGSEKLSPAQQKLVFENLREFSERDKTPYLKNIWEGIKESFGGEKDTGPILQTLAQLVESAALYGPKVHEENGELLTDFVGIDIPRESRKEWKQAFDSLNETAHRLSKTPASWQEDGIGTHSERESKVMSFIKDKFSPERKRYNEYQEIQASYEASKKELSRVLGEAGYEPGVIAVKLVDIDKNVYALQFQQTSPDAMEAIKDIPDASMWKGIGKSLCNKSYLKYMAIGFVTRTALASALNVLAVPVTSAAIESKRSWDRAAAQMRERDRAARMGARDASKEALNIVNAEMTIDIAGEKREVGATQKLQYLIDKYSTLRETNDIEGPPSPKYIKDMNKLLESIRVRASYVEDKQRLNRISYGSKEERAVQMATLYETLAFAQMIVADNKDFPKNEAEIPDAKPKTLEERLAYMLSKNENAIQNKRRTRQIKTASANALRAGAFAWAGGEIAREVQEMGLGEKLGKLMNTQNTAELSPFDEPLLTPEEIARANAGTVPPVGANAANFPYAEEAPMSPNAANFPYAEEAPMSPNAANFPYAEEAPMAAEYPPYTIRSGDTLTKIMKEQMPEIQALEAGKAQNTAIEKILRGLSAEELQSIGIRSGNVDLIYAGDTINTEALHTIVESHQPVIDEVASRASGVANTAQYATEGNTSGARFTPEPLNVTPQVIETPSVVRVEAEGFGAVSKYEYLAGIPDTAEAAATRTMIWNEAQNGVEKWTKIYPRISSGDALKAGIIEGHFKNLFGARWSFAGGTNAVDFLERGPRFTVENPERMTREFRALAEAVAKPPMRIVPTPTEGVNAFLERASMAYALQGEVLPEGNLIRKIEGYYQTRH